MSLIFVITSPVTLLGFRNTETWLWANAWHVTDDSYPNNINYFAIEANRGSYWQATCQHPKTLPTHFTAVRHSYSTINLHNLLPGARRQNVSLNTGKDQEMGTSCSRSRIFHMNYMCGIWKVDEAFPLLKWITWEYLGILSPNCWCQKLTFLWGTKASWVANGKRWASQQHASSFVKTGI